MWRDHTVHGQYSDGSTSSDGSTYGAWLVHNTRETYYGGPLHSDLVVDGIVVSLILNQTHSESRPCNYPIVTSVFIDVSYNSVDEHKLLWP